MKAAKRKLLILPLLLCILVCAAALLIPLLKSIETAYHTRGKKDTRVSSSIPFTGSAAPVVNPPAYGGQAEINTAISEELQTLPGIGPTRAETIIQYRENISPFYYPEDLMRVSGIGSSTFEKLKDSIRCVPPEADDIPETESEESD